MFMYQTTIKKDIEIKGIGLHTGKKCKVTLRPSLADSGYIFCKKYKNDCITLKVSPFNVICTQLSTTINAFGQFNIKTIEHLISAFYGLGVDNVKIDVEGNEIPILDGSSIEFVNKIMNVGLRILPKKRKYLKIKKKIAIQKGDKKIEIIPSRFFKITSSIVFENTLIGEQKAYFNITPSVYINDIAKARTFGFKKSVLTLWNKGLGLGGNLDNTIIVDKDKILNNTGLRYYNEFVRHKILDLIGDISLVGFRIFGHIKSYKSGHELNNMLARVILEDKTSYSIIELTEEEYERAYTPSIIIKPQTI